MQIISCEQDIAFGLSHLLTLDPRLEKIVEKAGKVPLRLQQPGYAGFADIIVSQMVSKASAAAIWKRLLAATGPDLTASAILSLSELDLRGLGLSGAKAATLRRVATAVIEEQLDLQQICMQPGDHAIKHLTDIKGIGPWTAEVYLMFSAGHPDIFPVGDVALRSAVTHAFQQNERLTEKQLAEIARIWSPWRSVAARLFWAYYSVEMQRSVLPVGD